MASDVATVASDYGAAGENMKDGVHGAAVARGDDARFVREAVRIASNDSLRDAMARTARRAVEGLRPEQVASDFDDILQSLRAGGRDASTAMA